MGKLVVFDEISVGFCQDKFKVISAYFDGLDEAFFSYQSPESISDLIRDLGQFLPGAAGLELLDGLACLLSP